MRILDRYIIRELFLPIVFCSFALVFLILIAILKKFTTLSPNQCYFMVVLSGLLMHYYFDHWVFTQVSAVVPERSYVPQTRQVELAPQVA